MVWFTGTSTGRQYTVGARYSMAGDTYRANADGSFTNERTGRALKGSAGSDRVSWGGFSSGVAGQAQRYIASGGRSVSGGTSSRSVRGPGPGAAAPDGSTREVVTTGPARITVRGGGYAGGGAGSSAVVRTFLGNLMVPKDKALERVGNGHFEEAAGAISEIGWSRSLGGFAPIMSQDIKQRTEDDFIGTATYWLRNSAPPPPPSFVIDATNWKWDHLGRQYLPDPAQFQPPYSASNPRPLGDPWRDPLKTYRDLGQYPW